MMHHNFSNLWWQTISNAVKFRDKISEELRFGNNIVLLVPSGLPWYQDMRNNIAMEDNNIPEIVDIAETLGQKVDIAELQRYLVFNFTLTRGEGYRLDFYNYYATHQNPTTRSIVWLKGIPTAWQNQILSFLKEYAQEAKKRSLPPIIAELRDFKLENLPVFPQNTTIVDWKSFITEYDIRLFNYLIAAEDAELNSLQRSYVAEASATLTNYNAEQSATLICDYAEALVNNDLDMVRSCTDCVPEEFDRRLWEAQLSVFFPLVEKSRQELIAEYKHALEDCISNPPDSEYAKFFKNKQIEHPEDIEIGALFFLRDYLYGQQRVLSDIDFYRIEWLYNVRNHLAHLELIRTEDLVKFWE